LTARFQKTALSEKIIEKDLSRVEIVQPNPHTSWVLVLKYVRVRVRRVLPIIFSAPPIIKRRKQSNPSKLTIHPTQSLPSTLREK
jgi:hypothetical protein